MARALFGRGPEYAHDNQVLGLWTQMAGSISIVAGVRSTLRPGILWKGHGSGVVLLPAEDGITRLL